MRQQKRVVLVGRYSKAFYGVFSDTISASLVKNIQLAARFLHKHKNLLVLFKLSAINPAVKEHGIDQLCQQFNLTDGVKKLMLLMLKHKRAYLFAQVFDEIYKEYQKQNGICPFSIKSSHELNEDDLKAIQGFLVESTGCEIIYTYTIEKKLVAGIRLQSQTFLWEHSIHKQLQEVRRQLIR